MKALISVLIVILIVGLIGLLWYVSGYNKAVRLDEAVKTGWANVDTTLQRRLDLVPNLVETVKGYAKHEEDIFSSIASSREKYFQAGSNADKMKASNELSGFLSRLLMLQEAYPDLKANENFRDLQVQLEGTENRINVARTRYNEMVRQLNTYSKQFFGKFFCERAGVVAADYFEATEEAKATVPEVKFE
ncbi:MAG: LemA family protein [Planctomycetota bacterium]|jgi:LemA protein